MVDFHDWMQLPVPADPHRYPTEGMNRVNPYDPPTVRVTVTNDFQPSALRQCTLTAVSLTLLSLAIGFAAGLQIKPAISGPPGAFRFAFAVFPALSLVFGLAGAYFGCRYIARKTPLWYGPAAIGVFAFLFGFVAAPNVQSVGHLIAAIAWANCLTALGIPWIFNRPLANETGG